MVGFKSINSWQSMVHHILLDSYYQASLMTRLGTGSQKVHMKLLVMEQMKFISWSDKLSWSLQSADNNMNEANVKR